MKKTIIVMEEGPIVSDELPFPLPTLVTLVTSTAWQGKPNIIPTASTILVSRRPLTVGTGIARAQYSRNYIRRYSHELISETKQFVVNLPHKALRSAIGLAGSTSGRKIDKFKEAGLTPRNSVYVRPPFIGECLVNYECIVRETLTLGSHDFFIAEVIALHCKRGLQLLVSDFSYEELSLSRYNDVLLWDRLPRWLPNCVEAGGEEEKPGTREGTLKEEARNILRDLYVKGDTRLESRGTELFPTIVTILSYADQEGRPSLVVPFTTTLINRFPPIMGVLLAAKGRESRLTELVELLVHKGEFVLNVIDSRFAPQIRVLENSSSVNGFVISKLTPASAHSVSCPLVAEAPVSLECELLRVVKVGNDAFILGKIVAADVIPGLRMSSRIDEKPNWLWETVPQLQTRGR